MNKKRLTSVICFIFVLQLLIPVSMIGYSRFIDWGLRERASIYNMELNILEYYDRTNSVYLTYKSPVGGISKGIYASITTGEDGIAKIETTKKKPSGNYIRSQYDGYFAYPSEILSFDLSEPIDYDGADSWMLYMMDEQLQNQWGYGYAEAPVYFESAYAAVRVFKGYVRLDGVFVEGEKVADFIQRQLDAGAFVE